MARFKTVILLGFLTGLFLWVGGAVAGEGGALVALLLAGGMNVFAYWFSDRIALTAHHARELSRAEAPGLFAMVEDLAQRAGIPAPRLYVVDDPSPNAFATGRNPEHGAVAVTTGILDLLDEDELRGVLAHELAHIRNRDTLLSTIAATFAGAITYLAQSIFFFAAPRDEDEGPSLGGLGLIIVAPIVALLLQLALSRSREFRADESGARWAGGGDALARALLRLEDASHRVPPHRTNPAYASLYIVHPFAGSLGALLSTHPSTEERVARLRELRRSPLADAFAG